MRQRDERSVFHEDGGPKPFHSSSAVVLPGCMGGMFHLGGFGVSPRGSIVVGCVNPESSQVGGTPLPLEEAPLSKRLPDITRPPAWIDGAEWLFEPVGAPTR